MEKVGTMAERFLTVTEAKKSFCELVREIDERFDRIIVTRDGHPAAVLLAYEDYAGLEETLEIMADPALVEGVREGMEDIRAGRVVSLEDLDRELAPNAPTRGQRSRRAQSQGAATKRTRALARHVR